MYYTSSITTNSRILCNHLHFLFIAYTIRIRTKPRGGGGSKIGKILRTSFMDGSLAVIG